MHPLISVCIPTYNGAEYLRECLDSILAQTFTDFEVLIVDDQSSDETIAISQEYASLDERIKVVQNPRNLGLVGNWNRCAELASSEWIKFVFQDDLIAPTCLEKMLAVAEPDSAIVFCRRDFIFEGNVSEQTKQAYAKVAFPEAFLPASISISPQEISTATLKHFGKNFIGEPTVVMLRRSVFERFGAFNPNLIQWCDWEFWIRVASNTGIVYVPESLATFRVHGKSTTSANIAKRFFRQELDLCIMTHDFLYHSAYNNLRVALGSNQGISPLTRLFTKTYYYRLIKVKRSEKSLAGPQADIAAEWSSFVKSYPKFSEVQKISAVDRIYYLVQRKIVFVKWQLIQFFSGSGKLLKLIPKFGA